MTGTPVPTPISPTQERLASGEIRARTDRDHGPKPYDALHDRPDPRLDGAREPRVEAVEAYGPPRGVIRDKVHRVEEGPLGFYYRCPGCQRDHFDSLRYPLPRIVTCSNGVSTIVTPPAESIDTGDWDRHGRFGTDEEPGDV